MGSQFREINYTADFKKYIEIARVVDGCIENHGSLIDTDTCIRNLVEDFTHRGKFHYWPLFEVLTDRLYNAYSELEEPQRVGTQLKNFIMERIRRSN